MIRHTFSFDHLPADELMAQLVLFFNKQTNSEQIYYEPICSEDDNHSKCVEPETGFDAEHDADFYNNNYNNDNYCGSTNQNPAIKHPLWHPCWLNNDGNSVIGILPKLSWVVYLDTSNESQSDKPRHPSLASNSGLELEIFRSTRQDVSQINGKTKCVQTITERYLATYSKWVSELISYSDNQLATTESTQNRRQYNRQNRQHNNHMTNSESDEDAYNKELCEYKKLSEYKEHEQKGNEYNPDNSQSYINGLMGFIGYDISAKALSPYESSPNDKGIKAAKQPAAFLAHYDMFLSVSSQGKWQLHVQSDSDEYVVNVLLQHLKHFETQVCNQGLCEAEQQTVHKDKKLDLNQFKPNNIKTFPDLVLHNVWTYQQYETAFNATQNYLYQGDSYQINLTQKWQGTLSKDLRLNKSSTTNNNKSPKIFRLVNYLPALHGETQAPFAGFLSINNVHLNSLSNGSLLNDSLLNGSLTSNVSTDGAITDTDATDNAITDNATTDNATTDSDKTDKTFNTCESQTNLPTEEDINHNFNKDSHAYGDTSAPIFELLSCSPELFVQFNLTASGQQQILTKPIKGTVPRGKTDKEDIKLKQQLADSIKDKAENVMIVDLLRNDLGKYAVTGSVKVPKLFAIESFSNVHHMVSSITAIIKEEHNPLTVLFDSLPAGSITGAPKKRAVEIISELESDARGAYCGTMGYLNFDGTGQWNVLIRTLQANQQGEVNLWAGGGITVGSQCNLEYKECHDKVGNLLKILKNK